MAFARRTDPTEDVRRSRVTRQIVGVALAWVLAVPILLVVGLAGAPGALGLAAFLTLMLPFSGAVIATRNQRFAIGGCLVVLTLLMIVPAIAIARAG